MNIKYIVAVGGIVVVGIIGLVLLNAKDVPGPSDQTSVVTSFYPLYFFASEIGGNNVEVRNITPAGAEPHGYEPTPQDLIAIENSDLVVINGESFEPWANDIIETIDTQKTIVVVAGQNLATLTTEEQEEHVDPHVWLSPALAQQMAGRIRDGLIAVDPVNESDYRANADTLISKLTNLDTEFRTGLAQCARREIITSHTAFGYIAHAYNLRQVAISGISTEEEPSTQELAAVAEFARANNVKYIFFETLISPALSQTIATEVGAQTLVLNPLEGLTDEEISAGKDYLTEMRQNLTNLKTALQCTP